MRRAHLTVALGAACAALVLASCGDTQPTLRVSAAASLQQAFTRYAGGFSQAKISYSFAGSDALAAQIEHSARPDVFASANLKLPAQLYAKGLVEKPVEFAANKLVLAVPKGSSIASVAQAARPGVTIAAGTATVPIGAYTETVIARLPAGERRQVLADVHDRESDVTGIVGKLTQGAVDAGFVYATDAAAAHGSLRVIALPAALQPRVGYAVAIVRGGSHRAQSVAFVKGLLGGAGRANLLSSGFLPPASG
jgi:molybdate transport system substrate-binding protein